MREVSRFESPTFPIDSATRIILWLTQQNLEASTKSA